jgi:hypothetical protein
MLNIKSLILAKNTFRHSDSSIYKTKPMIPA